MVQWYSSTVVEGYKGTWVAHSEDLLVKFDARGCPLMSAYDAPAVALSGDACSVERNWHVSIAPLNMRAVEPRGAPAKEFTPSTLSFKRSVKDKTERPKMSQLCCKVNCH